MRAPSVAAADRASPVSLPSRSRRHRLGVARAVLRPHHANAAAGGGGQSCVRSTAASACGNGSTARIRSVSIDTAHAPVIDISLPAVTGCDARCATRQPATIRTALPTCSMVQGSRRTSTANSSVTTAFSCNKGRGQIPPRGLAGAEVAVSSDHEMEHARQRRRSKCQDANAVEGLKRPRQQRDREKAHEADGNADDMPCAAPKRTARIAPRTCNSLLRGWLFAHRATLDGADCRGLLAQPRSARLVTRAEPKPLGVRDRCQLSPARSTAGADTPANPPRPRTPHTATVEACCPQRLARAPAASARS